MIQVRVVIPVKARDLVEGLLAEFRKEESALMDAFGKKVANELKKRIRQQKLDVPGLKVSYLEYKAQRRWSLGVLIRTGGYMKSITYEMRRGSLHLLAEGMDPVSKKRYSEIAKHLEYGTRRMPARPHWRPMIPWAKKEFGRFVGKWAKSAIKRLIEEKSR